MTHPINTVSAANLSAIRMCFADIDSRNGQKLPERWVLPPSCTGPGSRTCDGAGLDSQDSEKRGLTA